MGAKQNSWTSAPQEEQPASSMRVVECLHSCCNHSRTVAVRYRSCCVIQGWPRLDDAPTARFNLRAGDATSACRRTASSSSGSHRGRCNASSPRLPALSRALGCALGRDRSDSASRRRGGGRVPQLAARAATYRRSAPRIRSCRVLPWCTSAMGRRCCQPRRARSASSAATASTAAITLSSSAT